MENVAEYGSDCYWQVGNDSFWSRNRLLECPILNTFQIEEIRRRLQRKNIEIQRLVYDHVTKMAHTRKLSSTSRRREVKEDNSGEKCCEGNDDQQVYAKKIGRTSNCGGRFFWTTVSDNIVHYRTRCCKGLLGRENLKAGFESMIAALKSNVQITELIS